jgi:nucleotide-binding universal stress UspA family protein
MVSTILVPMDDSEMAAKALEFTVDAHPLTEITVLHVVGGLTPFMGGPVGLAFADDVEKLAQERSKEVFENAREIASEHDTEIANAGELEDITDIDTPFVAIEDLIVDKIRSRDKLPLGYCWRPI